MSQTAKKQRAVVGRRLPDGSIKVLGEVDAPFVSSRLGSEIVSRETKQEHESEWHRVAADALRVDKRSR